LGYASFGQGGLLNKVSRLAAVSCAIEFGHTVVQLKSSLDVRLPTSEAAPKLDLSSPTRSPSHTILVTLVSLVKASFFVQQTPAKSLLVQCRPRAVQSDSVVS
jgi:hypothetical protein